MNVCFQCQVKGEVQGVFFRASAQQLAIDLGLSGYAHNQKDGTVEVTVCGEASKVEEMLSWLENGPRDARVDSVDKNQIELQDFNHFSIG